MTGERIVREAHEGDETYQVWASGEIPQVGQEAPDFTFVEADTDGSLIKHRLSEYRGKSVVVLAWINAAFTPTCREEICKLDSQLAEVDPDGDILSVTLSTDLPWAMDEWNIQNGIDYMTAHVDPETVLEWGRLIKEPVKFSQRGIDVIDRDGILRFSVSYDIQDETPDLTEPLTLAKELSAALPENP